MAACHNVYRAALLFCRYSVLTKSMIGSGMLGMAYAGCQWGNTLSYMLFFTTVFPSQVL